MPEAPIVAIGLLTRRDLERLGQSFQGAIPVPCDTRFDDLLVQLDRIGVEQVGKGVLLRPGSDGDGSRTSGRSR